MFLITLLILTAAMTVAMVYGTRFVLRLGGVSFTELLSPFDNEDNLDWYLVGIILMIAVAVIAALLILILSVFNILYSVMGIILLCALVLPNRDRFYVAVPPNHAAFIMAFKGLVKVAITPRNSTQPGFYLIGLWPLWHLHTFVMEDVEITNRNTPQMDTVFRRKKQTLLFLGEQVAEFSSGILNTGDPVQVKLLYAIHFTIDDGRSRKPLEPVDGSEPKEILDPSRNVHVTGDRLEENARRAVFNVENFYGSMRDLTDMSLRPICARKGYEDLITKDTTFLSEEGDIRNDLQKRTDAWGVFFFQVGVQEIVPMDDEVTKALTEKLKAKKEMEAIKQRAEGEAYRVDQVYGIIRKHGGTDIKQLEVLEKMSTSDNKVFFSLPELAHALSGFGTFAEGAKGQKMDWADILHKAFHLPKDLAKKIAEEIETTAKAGETKKTVKDEGEPTS
ncbi:SPFH domain-containing protein [Patescibacteria group bacterium]